MSLLSIFILSFCWQAEARVLVKIEGARDTPGTFWLGVFSDEEAFEMDAPDQSIKIECVPGSSGFTYELKLLEGVYGISVLHDENENKDMDYNFIGIPSEGFGFSNYYHTAFRKPVFSDFNFELKPGEKKEVTIRMKYY